MHLVGLEQLMRSHNRALPSSRYCLRRCWVAALELLAATGSEKEYDLAYA